jgi:hypothetical protein
MNHLVDHRLTPFLVGSIDENYRAGKVLIEQGNAVATGDRFIIYEADGGFWKTAQPEEFVQTIVCS